MFSLISPISCCCWDGHHRAENKFCLGTPLNASNGLEADIFVAPKQTLHRLFTRLERGVPCKAFG
jgi:hypothetical protein